MEDERWQPGMPVLARQGAATTRPDDPRHPVPQRVPETRPTPLQGVFIYLSVVVLLCGTIAISAWELGAPVAAPIVRLPVLVAAALLLLVTGDSAVRIARSVGAWWPVAPDRAAFRVVWVAVLLVGLALEIGAIVLAVLA
jgi:hypothetical protein